MMFAFLLLALAVSGLGVWTSRRWQMFGQALTVVGGLSLIIIVAVQVRQNLFPPEQESPGRCELAVGSCLGDFVGSDLEGQRGTVVLLFPSHMSAHLEQSYEQGFVLSLRHGHGALHLKALHLDAEKGQAGCSLAGLKKALVSCVSASSSIPWAGFHSAFAATSPLVASERPRRWSMCSHGRRTPDDV